MSSSALKERLKKQKTLSSVRVVHCKKERFDIYIGRPSKWGNPFHIGKDGTRQQVIDKYRIWVKKQPHLMDALWELRGKTLGCWCKPNACHGDVLADLVREHCHAKKKDHTNSQGPV